MTIAVLGAGMIGHAIALDLAHDYSLVIFDADSDKLEAIKNTNQSIHTVTADLLLFDQYSHWLKEADIVVTALPGFMGYRALEAVIDAGKNVVDISFFPENALELDALAKEKNVTAITDCGVAPGMSNLMAGRYNEEMKLDAFECYVGGLPKERKLPFQYKAPFSPVDVIQEYIRPARLVEEGRVVTRPALSDREIIYVEHAGELEAFNTDGLRSLIYTMPGIPSMKEKTLRYPGHLDLILALQQAGFFSSTPVTINNAPIVPLEFTSQLLISEWKLLPGEEELTVMKVILKGTEKTIEYNLFDEYNKKTGTTSMARTTGYTCSAAVNLVAQKLFSEPGVFPPELVGKNKDCFEFVMDYCKKRGINWVKKVVEN